MNDTEDFDDIIEQQRLFNEPSIGVAQSYSYQMLGEPILRICTNDTPPSRGVRLRQPGTIGPIKWTRFDIEIPHEPTPQEFADKIFKILTREPKTYLDRAIREVVRSCVGELIRSVYRQAIQRKNEKQKLLTGISFDKWAQHQLTEGEGDQMLVALCNTIMEQDFSTQVLIFCKMAELALTFEGKESNFEIV